MSHLHRSIVDPSTPPKQYILTKGDNNYIDDIELYQGLEWLERKHIVGKVRGFLPYIGYVTIAMVRSKSHLKRTRTNCIML